MKNSILMVVLGFIFSMANAWASGSTHDHDHSYEKEATGKNSVAVSKNGIYGKAPSLKKVETLKEVVARFSELKADDEVCVKGQVQKVCGKAGCWMELQSEGQGMKITFKDYGFFVPSDLTKKEVKVQGKISRKEFGEDGDKKSIFKFVATGVQVL